MAVFSVPITAGGKLEFDFNTGDVLFVLGANGTGKSSLMHECNRLYHTHSRWLSAHRQNWFESEAINLSPQGKRHVETSNHNASLLPDSRWKELNGSARADAAIYDLVDAENRLAREIGLAVRAENHQLAQQLGKKDAPVEIINRLLKSSNVPIELSVEGDGHVMASKSGSGHFSIVRLSDGERNALLIAANVLTAKKGTLFLIDEPERHLHRSIISPLLTQLFRWRKDCAFIVSTHDVLLPLDNPKSRTLLLRSCSYKNANGPVTWSADILPSEGEIDEVLKADILGSRNRILFVEGEGTTRSLDLPFYSLVFPEVSVIAKSGCREVEHAVLGIRSASNLHWLKAFGIVDSDGRNPSDIEELKARGIYAVPAYSVEALYYHSQIRKRVSELHAAVIGKDPQTLLLAAADTALAALGGHAVRMSTRLAEKAIRGLVIQQIPTKNTICAARPIEIRVDTALEVSTERKRFDTDLAARNLDALIQRYPVRETPALSKIAEALGFQNREQYESAVLKLLADDGGTVAFVRSLFGSLCSELSAP
jgi:energy-coupling factor transporter ATP-binding protein EcfA2